MEPTALLARLTKEILEGGTAGVIALLLVMVSAALAVVKWLITELKRSQSETQEAADKYVKLLDQHHQSNQATAKALREIEMVLIEIKSRL